VTKKEGTAVYNRYSFVYLSILLSLVLFSCNKTPIREENTDPPADTTINFKEGCYVINEGNFNWGNASVSFISSVTGKVEQDLFSSVNGRPLGDVAQSMNVHNDTGFIIVNNSDKIEVVSIKDFKSIKTINGFNSPRYIEFVGSSKAYVTNLKNDIAVVDLKTLTITKTIIVPEWTESIVYFNDYLYVTCMGKFSAATAIRRAKVLIISTKEDRIVDSIQTRKDPVSMVIDKKQKLWVLSTGGWDGYEQPSIMRIDPVLRIVEKAFLFDESSVSPSKLCINPTGDTLYFLDGGIYQMPVTAQGIPADAFIPSSGKLFYGLDIDPLNGSVWVTDALDYVQNGKVYQYNSSQGNLIKSYDAGRIPGEICFGTAK
jgi:DNA-binding beta-propeller fold protein YncE